METRRKAKVGRVTARRGGVYVLVLGASMLLTVAGLSAIAIGRLQLRSADGQRDWGLAGTHARSAIEIAAARLNADPSWRGDLIHGKEVDVYSDAQARMWYRLEDELDGDLSASVTDPVRVYGGASVGEALREFSVQMEYTPPTLLEVIGQAVYASSITTANTPKVSGSYVYTPGTLTVGGTLTASVKAGTISNGGTIVGEVQTGAKALSPLSIGLLDAQATAAEIPYASLPTGKLQAVVLSATSNPYGAPNARGVYLVRVPSTKTLTVDKCRVVGTLLVTLASSAKLEFVNAGVYEPAGRDLPMLVVDARASGTSVSMSFRATLSEPGEKVNFNPAAAPYQGASDSDILDVYPSMMQGVVHVLGSACQVELRDSFALRGAIICEGSLRLQDTASVEYDPDLKRTPPAPYRNGVAGMSPTRGTWRWAVRP